MLNGFAQEMRGVCTYETYWVEAHDTITNLLWCWSLSSVDTPFCATRLKISSVVILPDRLHACSSKVQLETNFKKNQIFYIVPRIKVAEVQFYLIGPCLQNSFKMLVLKLPFYKAYCFISTVLLRNSWILSISFALHLSRASLPTIKSLCATMQRLITLPINTSLLAPGSRGSGRNSRCLLLLLTSASTAVNLDHYDANLRRCSNPGEEPGSVRLVEREEESESEAGRRKREGENDERVWG